MLAPCGLLCNECEAFMATQAKDKQALILIAKKWSKLNNAPIQAEHLYCDGCQGKGKKSYYCEHLCEIKQCAAKKSLDTCGNCADFPCTKVEMIFRNEPEAKTRLINLQTSNEQEHKEG